MIVIVVVVCRCGPSQSFHGNMRKELIMDDNRWLSWGRPIALCQAVSGCSHGTGVVGSACHLFNWNSNINIVLWSRREEEWKHSTSCSATWWCWSYFCWTHKRWSSSFCSWSSGLFRHQLLLAVVVVVWWRGGVAAPTRTCVVCFYLYLTPVSVQPFFQTDRRRTDCFIMFLCTVDRYCLRCCCCCAAILHICRCCCCCFSSVSLAHIIFRSCSVYEFSSCEEVIWYVNCKNNQKLAMQH